MEQLINRLIDENNWLRAQLEAVLCNVFEDYPVPVPRAGGRRGNRIAAQRPDGPLPAPCVPPQPDHGRFERLQSETTGLNPTTFDYWQASSEPVPTADNI